MNTSGHTFHPSITRFRRPFDVMRIAPAGHLALAVTDRAWTPHLRPGEFAVIDTNDQAPQRGELYALRFATADGLRTAVVQIGRGLEPDAVPLLGSPEYALGVLTLDGWRRKIVGRVVGDRAGGFVTSTSEMGQKHRKIPLCPILTMAQISFSLPTSPVIDAVRITKIAEELMTIAQLATRVNTGKSTWEKRRIYGNCPEFLNSAQSCSIAGPMWKLGFPRTVARRLKPSTASTATQRRSSSFTRSMRPNRRVGHDLR